MRIDEAVSVLRAEPAFRSIGKTATRGHPRYQTAMRLNFERCDCSYADDAYGWHEYIASEQSGGNRIVVALWLIRGVIAISSRGYHTDGLPPCTQKDSIGRQFERA